MKPNAAIAAVLAGTGVWLLRSVPTTPGRVLVARFCAVGVLTIGSVTLCEYLFGWDLAVDQLVFHEPADAVGTSSPGRMGANAAAVFVLAGVGLFLVDVERRGVRPAQVLAVAIGAIALVPCAGYVYGAQSLAAFGSATRISLPGAVAYMLLSAALITVRPTVGLLELATSPGPGGHTVRRLVVPSIAVPIVIGWLIQSGQRAGLYEPVQTLALVVVAITLFFMAMAWSTASALHKADSRRRRAEEEQARLEDLLREAERKEERAGFEAKLHQAQRLETVGRLAGGVAHDFNNLLNAIINYADFVLRGLREKKARLGLDDDEDFASMSEDLGEIVKASERGAALTRQLLIFSRREVIRAEVLDLNEVVADTEKLLVRTIGANIELRTILGPDIPRVRANRGQIEQVLMNLAVNAGDAMAQGGTLTIETTAIEIDEPYATAHAIDPGRYVRLSVSDTGEGMSPEVIERAFEPFFTTKPQGKGTGLGLATVYGIAKQANGDVAIYSEPGLGTAVKVNLPAATEAAAIAQRRPHTRSCS